MSPNALTSAALVPKRYMAWNKNTGLFFSNTGFGFTEARHEFSRLLSETELLVVRYQWSNVEWREV